MRRRAHRKGEKEVSFEAPVGEKEEKEEAAAAEPAPASASKGARGRQGKGKSAVRRPKTKASLLNGEPASEPGGEVALASDRKASLKKHESASQAQKAKPLEAAVDSLPKPSAAPVEPGCAVPRSGTGRASGRRRAPVQSPPPPRPLSLEGDSCPPGKEIARRGQRSRRKKKEVAPQRTASEPAEEERAGPVEKQLASQLGQQERALRGQEGTEVAAAKHGALPRTRPVTEGEGNLPSPERPEPSLDQRSPRVFRKVLDRLKLAKEERAKASQLVNSTRDVVVAAIKRSPYFQDIEPLGAGSYYERVKVCSPNEFDILIKMPGLRFELISCDESGSCGAFYYMKMKRNPGKKNLDKFIENEQLSSSRMVLELTKIIKEGIKDTEGVTVSRKKPGCPAVTLIIGKEPSVITVDIVLGVEFPFYWCKSILKSLNIERWLGTKVKQQFLREPLYLVPKIIKKEDLSKI